MLLFKPQRKIPLVLYLPNIERNKFCRKGVTRVLRLISIFYRVDLKYRRCFKVEGPLGFSMTGVLSQIAGPLADAKIPIFVVLTFDTDYLLVKDKHFEQSSIVLGSQNYIGIT